MVMYTNEDITQRSTHPGIPHWSTARTSTRECSAAPGHTLHNTGQQAAGDICAVRRPRLAAALAGTDTRRGTGGGTRDTADRRGGRLTGKK